MDKAIVTIMLIIIGITTTLAIFNGIYPVITRSQSAISGAAESANERIRSRVDIIQVSANGDQVDMWVKNTGTSIISDVGRSDIFIISPYTVLMPEYGNPLAPYWEYQIIGENTRWVEHSTIKVSIILDEPLSSGTYSVKMVTPNGISDETHFSK